MHIIQPYSSSDIILRNSETKEVDLQLLDDPFFKDLQTSTNMGTSNLTPSSRDDIYMMRKLLRLM